MRLASPRIFHSIAVLLRSNPCYCCDVVHWPCSACLMAAAPRTQCRLNWMKNSEEKNEFVTAQCRVFRISSILACSEMTCKRKYIYQGNVESNIHGSDDYDFQEKIPRERKPKITVFITTQNHVSVEPITLTLPGPNTVSSLAPWERKLTVLSDR